MLYIYNTQLTVFIYPGSYERIIEPLLSLIFSSSLALMKLLEIGISYFFPVLVSSIVSVDLFSTN